MFKIPTTEQARLASRWFMKQKKDQTFSTTGIGGGMLWNVNPFALVLLHLQPYCRNRNHPTNTMVYNKRGKSSSVVDPNVQGVMADDRSKS